MVTPIEVVKATTAEQQFKEEIGDNIVAGFDLGQFQQKRQLKLTSEKDETDYILRQKYGLVAPEITVSENTSIKIEARNARRFKART